MGEEIGSHPHINFPICPLKGYRSSDSTGGNELSPASPSTLKSFFSKVTEMSVGKWLIPGLEHSGWHPVVPEMQQSIPRSMKIMSGH